MRAAPRPLPPRSDVKRVSTRLGTIVWQRRDEAAILKALAERGHGEGVWA